MNGVRHLVCAEALDTPAHPKRPGESGRAKGMILFPVDMKLSPGRRAACSRLNQGQ